MWPSDCGVDHQRHAKAAAHLGDGRGRLDHAAVTGQRREVQAVRRPAGPGTAAASSTTSRPSPSAGNARTSKPCAAIIARLGPYSPGRQATVQLPGQLPSNRSRAWVDPVVKTTSEPFVPISAATTARPASSTGPAASAATYPPTSASCRACWAAASMTAKLCREQAALSTCSPAAFGRADVDRAHRCPAAKSSTLRASTTRTPSSRALRICAGANAGILRCWSRWNSRSRTHRRLCRRRVRWWCWVGRGEGGGGQTQRPGCAQGGGERPGGIAAISLVTAALAIGERPKAFRHRQEAAAQLRTEIRLTLRKDTTARSQRLGGASTRAIKCGVFGMAERGEAEQSVDRGRAGVAAPNPVAAFVFEVV